jgi:hypothetical protein
VEERLIQQNILYIPMTILQHATSRVSVFTSLDVKADPSRTVISMDQQSIVTYLSLNGLNAVEIHNNLVATLKGEEKQYRNVTYCLRRIHVSADSVWTESDSMLLAKLSRPESDCRVPVASFSLWYVWLCGSHGTGTQLPHEPEQD